MGGRKMLELRLAASATPARVARAATMLADVVELAFPGQRDSLTIVVENLRTRVMLRAWDAPSMEAASAFVDFIDNPTDRELALDAPAVARVLASYCRDEIAHEPEFLRPKSRTPFRVVDHEFIEHLSVVTSKRPRAEDQRVSGTTVIVTPVLRCGRSKENARATARLVFPGIGEREADIEEGAFEALCDAVKARQPAKVRMRVKWRRGAGGDLEVCPEESVILGCELRGAVTSGARMVEILGTNPVLSPGDLDAVLRSLREEDGG